MDLRKDHKGAMIRLAEVVRDAGNLNRRNDK